MPKKSSGIIRHTSIEHLIALMHEVQISLFFPFWMVRPLRPRDNCSLSGALLSIVRSPTNISALLSCFLFRAAVLFRIVFAENATDLSGPQ